jgi:hypothetical protein
MALSSERPFEPKLNLARRARVIDDTESGSFKDLAGRPEIGMIRRIEQIAPEPRSSAGSFLGKGSRRWNVSV